MKQFNNLTIKSTCVPLLIENVDTDQIIPARFLKAITREGFGENLFRDWRLNEDGSPKKEFVLNNPLYKGEILVAGRNFGCGSSREHAAWALVDYGFKAVVSSFFADIFKNNALINRLLPVQVSEAFLKKLFETIKNDPRIKVTIDIKKQTIYFDPHNVILASKARPGSNVDSGQARMTKLEERFPLDPYRKLCFMQGYDDVDYLLSLQSKVKTFEEKRVNDYSIR